MTKRNPDGTPEMTNFELNARENRRRRRSQEFVPIISKVKLTSYH